MKRSKKPRPANLEMMYQLQELHLAITQHVFALRATLRLFGTGNQKAGLARLEGAVAALEASLRGHVAGSFVACPTCGKEQEATEWLDEKRCLACGAEVQLPGDLQ